jgi:YVTN family beta-propeller protein
MRARAWLVVAGTAAAAWLAATPAGAAPPPVNMISVGTGPTAIAIAPSRSEAYVANAGSVSVIDLQTTTQTANIGTGAGEQQTAIGAFLRGTKVYVAAFGLNTMVAFNPGTNAVTPGIAIGFGATTIVRAGNGFAYIGESRNQGQSGRIQVVNARNDRRVDTITVKAGVQTATAVPGNPRIWAGSVQDGRVWVIDTRTNRVVRRLMATDAGPVSGIAFAPDGKRAWVFGLGGVSVLSRATGKQVAFIPVTRLFQGAPNAGPIAINQDGTRALAVNSTDPGSPGNGTVAVINTATLGVTRRIPVGGEPLAMALDNARDTTYVPNFLDDNVSYTETPG